MKLAAGIMWQRQSGAVGQNLMEDLYDQLDFADEKEIPFLGIIIIFLEYVT